MSGLNGLLQRSKGKTSRVRAEEQCDEAILSVIFSTFLCAFFPFYTEIGIYFTSFLSSPLLLWCQGSEFPQVTLEHPQTSNRELLHKNPAHTGTEICGTRQLLHFWRDTFVLLLPL